MTVASISRRVFKGMPAFWQFVTSYLESTAEGLAGSDGLCASELPNPKRLKLELTQPPQSGGGAAAPDALAVAKQLASIFNNWGDVANLEDLHGFDELGSPVLPSSIS